MSEVKGLFVRKHNFQLSCCYQFIRLIFCRRFIWDYKISHNVNIYLKQVDIHEFYLDVEILALLHEHLCAAI